MKNIYVHLSGKLKEKTPLALATIVETRGSTPQVTGASALFSSRGLLEGTLGGGLLEADAQKKAFRALKEKTSGLFQFSLKDDISEEGAICGGDVRILIDGSLDKYRETFQVLSRSLEQRKSGVLATRKTELMRKKFLEEGWATLRQFNRVHAPIGVSINSKTVEEIAVSIAAQLIQVRSQIQEKGKEKK